MTTTKSSPTASEGWYAHSERTSQTDDQRIKDVMPLPPPEHLIRFFPIAGTPVETLIGDTRAAIRRIMQKKDDRRLADLAWRVLYLKQGDQFYPLTLEEDRAAHARHPDARLRN